jgi:hypothetical protein
MAYPKYIEKTLRMSQEVSQIFDDLDAYRDHCRFNGLKFNEKDLYRGDQYRRFDRDRKRSAKFEKHNG